MATETIMQRETGHVLPTMPTQVVPHVTPRAAAVAILASYGEKPEKFTGVDFKRWQQKMLFYLTMLNLARFFSENALNSKRVREMLNLLMRKYKTEDVGAKNFLVGRFLDFKMVDSKPVITQVQELQVIFHEIHGEGMTLSQSFQVAAIVEKLPPAWKDFKNYLKHKRKEMNVEELIVRLHIEEGKTIRVVDRHWCHSPCLLGQGDVCYSEEYENGEKLFMGNSTTSEINGQGKIVLKMTSGKELTLNNMLYVPDIRKNLVSGLFLNKHGFRIVFESDKVV
ncbi:uncharacterized protein [Primulina eburnea]|uniref:uncharacterized protein n=1 Tax=Primulina eburnea TaxID=1245227 RepID=UPI003C6BEA75